jgi:putative ATPase
MNNRPLADEIRPQTLEEVVGQQHMLGKNGVLRRIIEGGIIPNMIFYGPSGTGKTTVANIIANRTNKTLHRLNATTATISDIRDVIADVDTLMAPNGVLLYLDEIQYFNKKQQQSLLEFMENGKITVIASTTENPYFALFNAVLSRATVFEFKPVEPADIEPAVKRAFRILEQRQGFPAEVDNEVLSYLASSCGGDVRKAINGAELLYTAGVKENGRVLITMEDAVLLAQKSAMRYDKDGDSHYDILSALQKSIRGSDPNAALHYLGRLLEAGDLVSACRRLMVIASEDVGLAYPQAVSIVKSCIDAANMLGLPEARIPLAEAAILMATAPKSNSAICGIDAALSDIRRGNYGPVPAHLMDAHYQGSKKLGRGLTYEYPHDFPDHYVPQPYLPDRIRDAEYYHYGDNKTENAARVYWERVKGKYADGTYNADEVERKKHY